MAIKNITSREVLGEVIVEADEEIVITNRIVMTENEIKRKLADLDIEKAKYQALLDAIRK
jgi:hypothetical protein